MKVLIKLSNFSVWSVSSKCTISSKTESEGKVKVEIYGKGIAKMFNNISQDDKSVGFKVDLSQYCRARLDVSLYLRVFSNLFNKF